MAGSLVKLKQQGEFDFSVFFRVNNNISVKIHDNINFLRTL